MATPYSELYDVFWSQVTDPTLLSMDTTDAIKQRLLLNAIPQFRRCKQDLTNRNDTTFTFIITLTDEEKLILGILMVNEYLKSQITSIDKIRQVMSNKDWSITSQANHLQQLMALRQDVKREVDDLIVAYTYNNADLSGLK